MEKPAAFPQTLEIETTDFHIPSAPATIANIDIQRPKGAFPSLPTVLLQAHPSIGKDSHCGPPPRRLYTPDQQAMGQFALLDQTGHYHTVCRGGPFLVRGSI